MGDKILSQETIYIATIYTLIWKNNVFEKGNSQNVKKNGGFLFD